MPKGKIAFVVGHASWGKSMTLRALTNGNFRLRRTTIAGDEYFIRRLSNDDQPAGFIKFMMSLDPVIRPCLIAALCPQFDESSAATRTILATLRAKGYQLFFWVIEKKYGTTEVVTAKEIQQLSGFGKVEVFSNSADAVARSKTFKRFVENVVGT